jgi:hypothetical protein
MYPVRSRILLILLPGLAACAPQPVVSVQAGQAVLLAAPAALDAAGSAFVGGGGGGGGLPGLDGDLLTGGAGTPVQTRRSRSLGVAAGLHQPLGPGPGGGDLGLSARVTLGVSQAGWHLPQGLGLFVDPMDIRITARTLAPELRLHWDRPLAGGAARLGLSAGAGVLLADSRTRARSALVALDHRSRQRQPYVLAGAALRRDLPGGASAGLALDVMAARPHGVAGLRLTADLAR